MSSAPSYFSNFPTISYSIDGTLITQSVTNIFTRAVFQQIVLNSTVVLLPYIVQEGDTPEIIADKLYGNSDLFWIVTFANNIYNLWTDWYLDYDKFNAYISAKYGSQAAAMDQLDHYEDQYGNYIDQPTYAANPGTSTSVSVFQQEYNQNQAKRTIRLLDPQYVSVVLQQLQQSLLASTPVGSE